MKHETYLIPTAIDIETKNTFELYTSQRLLSMFIFFNNIANTFHDVMPLLVNWISLRNTMFE